MKILFVNFFFNILLLEFYVHILIFSFDETASKNKLYYFVVQEHQVDRIIRDNRETSQCELISRFILNSRSDISFDPRCQTSFTKKIIITFCNFSFRRIPKYNF